MVGRRRGGQDPGAARAPQERQSRRAKRAEEASRVAAATGELGPHAFVTWFIGAAKNADLTYLSKRDPTPIGQGIEVWELVTSQGLFAGAPPESLVQAHITVANLYRRRYEIDARPEDFDRALSYLRRAEQHVIPGSDDDALLKMSSANWLELRFRRTADRSDLDLLIEQYREVIDMLSPGSSNVTLATGQLGRALLSRYRLTGSADDLRQARALLMEALAKMGPEHPATPILADAFSSSLQENPPK
jgi:hypothetical protein